jgi:sugar lactone lactonase YvrE
VNNTSVWSPEVLELGEGPLTHHLRGSLVWCDINNRAMYERAFESTESRKFDLPVMPSAAGIIDDKRVLVATEIDFRVLNLDTGESEIGTRFPEDGTMRSNDGRVHPSGAFWVGTMAIDGNGAPGAIWRLLDGKLERMIDEVVVPNSICFAADGSFAYYTDTPHRAIWKIPTDPQTGDVTGEKTVFATLPDSLPGGPDGSIVDGDGNLWNARWGGSAVDVYNPRGERIASHAVPVRHPTCPSFIGNDRIVTTSATAGLTAETIGDNDGKTIQIHTPVRARQEPIVRP